jgi:hypothetical protein
MLIKARRVYFQILDIDAWAIGIADEMGADRRVLSQTVQRIIARRLGALGLLEPASLPTAQATELLHSAWSEALADPGLSITSGDRAQLVDAIVEDMAASSALLN